MWFGGKKRDPGWRYKFENSHIVYLCQDFLSVSSNRNGLEVNHIKMFQILWNHQRGKEIVFYILEGIFSHKNDY
jgi:hypothetical protein